MLGTRIREMRQGKSLTLSELAEKTQLTASYISQVERDLIDPSLTSLRKISKALDAPIYAFLSSDEYQHVVIKANERKKLALPDNSIVYEFLTPMAADKLSNPKMEIIYYELCPKSWSSDEYITHAADECIFLLSGQMEVYLGDEKYLLNVGDSIYIKENVPHRLYNYGKTKAIGISNICPPIY